VPQDTSECLISFAGSVLKELNMKPLIKFVSASVLKTKSGLMH